MQNYSGMCVLWSHTSAVLLNHEYFSESESVSRSVVSDSATPWTAAHQAPLSMEFSRQEYWSGFPFPSPHINTKDMDRQRPPIATSRYIFNRKVYTCLLKDSTAVVLMVP